MSIRNMRNTNEKKIRTTHDECTFEMCENFERNGCGAARVLIVALSAFDVLCAHLISKQNITIITIYLLRGFDDFCCSLHIWSCFNFDFNLTLFPEETTFFSHFVIATQKMAKTKKNPRFCVTFDFQSALHKSLNMTFNTHFLFHC